MLTDGAIATDTFAEPLGEISETHMAQLQQMASEVVWRSLGGRNYDTAEASFWEPCSRAFWIRIPPKGNIPRHHDVFIPGTTHHLIVQSNEKALNCWLDTQGVERSIHLEQGQRYRVAREPLHWATNEGDSDRIHLLIEYW